MNKQEIHNQLKQELLLCNINNTTITPKDINYNLTNLYNLIIKYCLEQNNQSYSIPLDDKTYKIVLTNEQFEYLKSDGLVLV
jgi:hypothetical protein